MSAADKAALTAASAAKRSERAEVRRDAEERAQLGFLALAGMKAEARAEELVDRMLRLALSSDDQTAIAGLRLLQDRVYGRPVNRTEDLTPPERPATLEELHTMGREQRLALLRTLGH